MFDSSVISRSGQGPKAALALTAVILGGTITMAGSFVLKQFAPFAQVVVAMAGAILAICGLLVGCFMIRFPSCKKRCVTDWMRRQSAGSWMFALVSAQTCPNCGYPRRSYSDAAQPTLGAALIVAVARHARRIYCAHMARDPGPQITAQAHR